MTIKMLLACLTLAITMGCEPEEGAWDELDAFDELDLEALRESDPITANQIAVTIQSHRHTRLPPAAGQAQGDPATYMIYRRPNGSTPAWYLVDECHETAKNACPSNDKDGLQDCELTCHSFTGETTHGVPHCDDCDIDCTTDE